MTARRSAFTLRILICVFLSLFMSFSYFIEIGYASEVMLAGRSWAPRCAVFEVNSDGYDELAAAEGRQGEDVQYSTGEEGNDVIDADRDQRIPEGMDFLRMVWGEEDKLEEHSDAELPKMGKKAPQCLAAIGTVLSLIDRMASCWWGCPGGDHMLEYLCGRVASTGGATLRLTRLGFYDEALLLCRSLGEIANLLFLFVLDPAAQEQWRGATRAERLREFGPVKVRIRLEERGVEPPIDEERYRLLSERSAHVHPETKPQAYNLLGVPSAFAMFQQEGLLICINELALTLVFCSFFGAKLIKLERSVLNRVMTASRNLAAHIGGVGITQLDALRAETVKDEATRAALVSLGDELRTAQPLPDAPVGAHRGPFRRRRGNAHEPSQISQARLSSSPGDAFPRRLFKLEDFEGKALSARRLC